MIIIIKYLLKISNFSLNILVLMIMLLILNIWDNIISKKY